jgi:hypothetical protein
LRRKVSHFLALVVIAALSVSLFAGVADARSSKMSAKQKAAVRAKLRKQIKKNPRVIQRKSFVKKAALVNFKLPVTLRLRGGNTPTGPCNGFSAPAGACQPTGNVVPGNSNPNKATVDLGASLGKREVDLGGKLAAEIVFRDSYDGGALGNVDLTILPSSTKALQSTSIPLLWNDQVTQNAGVAPFTPGGANANVSRYDANDLYLDGLGLANSGCGNFTTTDPGAGPAPLKFAANILPGGSFNGIPQPGGLIGYPVSTAPGFSPLGFLPINPDIDDVVNGPLAAGTKPGNNDLVGGNPSPFPAGPQSPTFSNSVKNTVLRTNALDLTVAPAGTVVDQTDTSPNGPNGSQNIVIGKSGGQANLFGNIPGKGYGIDVTVSLATQINSIIRVVDQDSFHTGLYAGQNWPAGVFNCRQIWTGWVQNYIPDVRLKGDLKIAPGLTSDGHLRIAKATVNTTGIDDARFAVAACLMPKTTYAKRQGNNTVPTPAGYPGSLASTSALPVDTTQNEPRPAGAGNECNTTPDTLVANSALPPSSVSTLTGASSLNGYTVANNGSKVSVAADLSVQNVSIDVLIGDV